MEASGMDDETFEDAQEGDHTFLDALVSLPTGLAARSALVDDSEPPTPAAAFAEPLETEAEACESAAEPSADSDLSLPGPAPPPFTEHQNGQHGAIAALARAPSDAAARSTHTSAGQRKARARLDRLGMRLRQRVQQLWRHDHILLKDKLSFLLGCTMLWGCAFWLGHSPHTFYKLYTFLGLMLFAVRYFSYRRKRQHYYLFDFCYMANLLLLFHLWIMPEWTVLQQATFAFNTGPLTWSILAFRNSLVFHDLDKVTSLYLHLVPAMVSWSLRWYTSAGSDQGSQQGGPSGLQPGLLSRLGICSFPAFPGEGSSGGGSSSSGAPGHDLAVELTNESSLSFPASATCAAGRPGRQTTPSATLSTLVLIPMSLYLVWAVLYYLQIFVFSAKKIQQRGYQTLFKYVTTQKRGAFHSISKRVPTRLQPQIYLLLHCLYSLCTLLVAMPCWRYFSVHTILLALMASSSIWTGASYYFEVFAKRYYASITQAVQQAETDSGMRTAQPSEQADAAFTPPSNTTAAA